MRRKDREITDFNKMLDIMEACDCCRIGLADKSEVYIVPLNFGYEYSDNNITLYFHCAKEGRKINLISQQNTITFEMDTKHSLVESEIGCKFSFLYQCIMGKGNIEIIKDTNEKIHGLNKIMKHYSHNENWNFSSENVNRIHVLKLSVSEWSCKEH